MNKYDEIKIANDIVEVISDYLTLDKKGNSYKAICPFHEDTSPSFSIEPKKQIYKCFACGAGGDVVKFVKEIENISYEKALAKLAQRVNIIYEENTKEKTYVQRANYNEEQIEVLRCLKKVFNYYFDQLFNAPQAQEYLKSRNITQEIINTFHIGFAKGNDAINFLKEQGFSSEVIYKAGLTNEKGNAILWNRIIFPIKDAFGYMIGFSARTIVNNEAKYINSKEGIVFHKSSVLYNFDKAHIQLFENGFNNPDKELYVCEGMMDVIALYRANIKNAVALMGTALTQEHVNLLKFAKKVILFLDGDTAGIKAAFGAAKLLTLNYIDTQIVFNKENKDPDEIINAYGEEKLYSIIKTNLVKGIDFIFETLAFENDLAFKDAEGNTTYKRSGGITQSLNFFKEFDKYLQRIKSNEVKETYYKILKNVLGIDPLNFKDQKNITNRKATFEELTNQINTTSSEIINSFREILIYFLILNNKFLNFIFSDSNNQTTSKLFEENMFIQESSNKFRKKFIQLEAFRDSINDDQPIQSEIQSLINKIKSEAQSFYLKNENVYFKNKIGNKLRILYEDVNTSQDEDVYNETKRMSDFIELYYKAYLENLQELIIKYSQIKDTKRIIELKRKMNQIKEKLKQQIEMQE
ncbi:DNA primase [Mycoplasma sp. M5725]|uniref:DNA primase n=1 Tax=Mycoplasma phocimorsus TaxID=3045839 RepID=A0AAJ1PT75_9MOLU|nr:DNA primase [Mycoplasma phocimorsus]MDJ1645757.1 DNA primase [Mycoplasma phocimorsus]